MPTSHQSPELVRVAVVADAPSAAGHIVRCLRDCGYAARPYSLNALGAYERVRELRPPVVVLRADAADATAVAHLARIIEHGGPAVVLLTPAACAFSLRLARDSGALVHLVEPVSAQALAAAVWLAMSRAQDLRQLSSQLIELRESLASRKVVERAKAILMRRLELSEEAAHRRLQTESRNRNRKLAETAWHVIKAEGELSRTRSEEEEEAEAIAH